MKDLSSEVKSIKFSSSRSVSTQLKKLNIQPEIYQDVFVDAFSLGPKQGRMLIKGLLKSKKQFQDRNHILTTVRKSRNAKIRMETIRAYKESKMEMEMITSLSLMTTIDASKFFSDYFIIGGKVKDIIKWLANISRLYVTEKRKNNLDLSTDGFWGDLWDDLVDAGTSIGESIITVVDAVVDAGKDFAEIVDDILDYPVSRINNIIEALIDFGKEIGEFIDAAIQKGTRVAEIVVKALKLAGTSVITILRYIREKHVDFIKEGIRIFIKIGVLIRDTLTDALRIARSFLFDVVNHLIDLGHSVWYILKWSVTNVFEVTKGIFGRLLQIGESLADLVAWCGRRTFETMKKGFKVLVALGNTFGTIIVTVVTDPRNLLEKSFGALKELGATAYDFLKSTVNLGPDILKRTYRTIVEIGLTFEKILKFAAEQGAQMFREIVELLLKVGLKIFEILLWSASKSLEIFGWAMDAVDKQIDSFLEIIEWVSITGGPIIEFTATWMAEKARSIIDWFKNKVISPILAAGKLILAVILASISLPFLAATFVVLDSLVDADKVDFKNWPDTLVNFQNEFNKEIVVLPAVDNTHKYVLVSDIHKESREDVESGIGHFHKNKELFKSVLNHYAEDHSWTLLSVGDSEEFWYNSDVTSSDPVRKVDRIIDTHDDVYSIYSDKFYKNNAIRHFFKFRGNHDDVYKNSKAVNKFRNRGFPLIQVYLYALVPRNGSNILVMHGQQFDPYNCDANSEFGKFASYFVGTSLDTINDMIVDMFGQGARIEGFALAPYFKRSEWLQKIDSEVANPEIVSDIQFDENDIVRQIRKYQCSIIIGHTHGPKVMADSQNSQRFYINSGTSGWWEGCIWSVELTPEDVFLKAWTEDSLPDPFKTFKLSEAKTF